MLKKYSNVAVVGSRLKNKTEEEKQAYDEVSCKIYEILDRFEAKYKPECLISGGADGVDSIAENWSESIDGLSKYIIRPRWYPNGKDKPMFKGAGFVRNKNIVEESDIVLAFTNGSNGTANSIEWAKKLNKPLIVFDLQGNMIEKSNI